MLSSLGSLHSASLAGIALNSFCSHTWIINIGATNNICCSLDFFGSYKSCHIPLHVQLPNNTTAFAIHIGNDYFSPNFLLDNVFYIPSFKFNLLSVSQLTKLNKYQVIFSSNSCEFQNVYGEKKISEGRFHEGLLLPTTPCSIFLYFPNSFNA